MKLLLNNTSLKRKKRNKNKKNSKYQYLKKKIFFSFDSLRKNTKQKNSFIYLLRSFNETCFARSSAGNACDCCSGVK